MSDQKKVHVAEVVRHGEKLIVPEGMPYLAARQILKAKEMEEEQYVGVFETIDCSPWDGALALKKAIEQVNGIAQSGGMMVQTMFGAFKSDARTHKVPSGPGQTVEVLWGFYNLAATDGQGEDMLETSTDVDKQGHRVFQVKGRVRRKYLPMVNRIIELTRKFASEESLYKGKAVRVQFTDRDGDPIEMVLPDFIDTSRTKPENAIFSGTLEQQIGATLYAPIVAIDEARAAGVPFKRGVVLAGPYGTGKTLLASNVAKLAQDNGITFIYAKHGHELAEAYNFAQQYQPAVVFIEDLDSVVNGEERTEQINEILNIVDGVDTKNAQVMLVLTTNHLEDINKAMLRKGRIDAILQILPPDADAAGRLVKLYGAHMISKDVDLAAVGEVLAGQNAATIREAVERAKLAYIWRTRKAPTTGSIQTEDLVTAAEQTVAETNLVNRRDQEPLSDREKAAHIIREGLADVRQCEDNGNGNGRTKDSRITAAVSSTING